MCNPCELMMSQASIGQSPEARGLDEYPPELIEEFKHLSFAIYSLADHFQDQVQIKIWDPHSLQGLWKCIRYGVRRYPTFLIGGQVKLAGLDPANLERSVQSVLESGISAL